MKGTLGWQSQIVLKGVRGAQFALKKDNPDVKLNYVGVIFTKGVRQRVLWARCMNARKK